MTDSSAQRTVSVLSLGGTIAMTNSAGVVPTLDVDALLDAVPDRGLINSGFLDPFKARILLHLLVAADADHHAIATAFDAASGQVAMPG